MEQFERLKPNTNHNLVIEVRSLQNQLEVFNYQSKQVRTVIKDGEPWFIAKDVCDVLELGNSRMALERLDVDEKGVSLIDTPGGTQQMHVVNEPGLYSLILGSRKPEAKAFKRWITHEVLPSIHKTGSYSSKPQTQLEALQQAVAAMVEHERQLSEVKTVVTETQKGIEQARQTINNIKSTKAELPKEQWRKWVNSTFVELHEHTEYAYETLKRESYKLLEERAGADLSQRVRNARKRLQDSGATKTVVESYRTIEAIESDKRLREIYTSVVKELRIKYLA